MGMTIDDKIHHLQTLKTVWEIEVDHSLNPTDKEIAQDIVDSLDSAIDTMCKYQKIEDIYYHQSGEALENSLKAVIEDGKID